LEPEIANKVLINPWLEFTHPGMELARDDWKSETDLPKSGLLLATWTRLRSAITVLAWE
jgi:hypothetical protein